MGNSNLPPGVTENMIPGNRPEDADWEQFIERICEDADEMHLDVGEATKIWEAGLDVMGKKRKAKRG